MAYGISWRVDSRPGRIQRICPVCFPRCEGRNPMHYIAQDVTNLDVAAPFILVAAQTLMQTITPTEIQGRVFASRSGLAGIALIIAVVASPLLSQHVFEPLMRDGQILSSIAGLLDAGKSAGMRVVFVLAGLGMLSLPAWKSVHCRALHRQMLEGVVLPAKQAYG